MFQTSYQRKRFYQLMVVLLLIPFIAIAAGQPNNDNGGDEPPDIITSISPVSAKTGDNFILTINLDESLGTPPVPPSDITPESVKIGNIEGTNIQRSDYVITAAFNLSATLSYGKQDVSIQFPAPADQPDANSLVITEMNAFEIISTADPGALIVIIQPDSAVNDGAQWKVDNGSWQDSNVTVSDLNIGSHTISFKGLSGWNIPSSQSIVISSNETKTIYATYTEISEQVLTYPIVDTDQSQCYATDGSSITCPGESESSYGQDGQYNGFTPNYTDNGDETITDNITGLMWQKNPGDKMTFNEAKSNVSNFNLAGYTDWRLPSIKELYSLILFSGKDVSIEGTDTSELTPFINNNYFDFEYGDTEAGERIIDSQFVSSTEYVNTTMNGEHTVFGVNFADGRIKGYGTEPKPNTPDGKTFFVLYVRGNTSYGVNNFVDNDDTTITDNATGLMWTQDDSKGSFVWEDALEYCEDLTLSGYNDWRLPNAKELQSILDYTRSPDTTSSAAIDPIFNSSSITNEAGQVDYPYYWSSTTHDNFMNGSNSAYLSFGRAMGYMSNEWLDVHGAGAQRSDPKTGNPDNYPEGHGPQGDAIRIYNYARCVRDAEVSSTGTGSLIVNISPQEVIDEGLQWQVDNDGSWHNSGDLVSNLNVGSHKVIFKTHDDWFTPEDQLVIIKENQTITITGTYTEKSPEPCNPGDLDLNGKIELKDVIILLQKFIKINLR